MLWWRRPDGDLVRDLPLTRRVMPYIMRTRNESAVYYEYTIDLRRADAFLRVFNEEHPGTAADVFHLWLYAFRDGMTQYPVMNRFVVGGRLYQRRELWLSYSVKARLQQGAPLVVVKRRFPEDEPFEDMVAGMQAQIHESRFGKRSYVDKELALLFKFPGFVRRLILGLQRVADRFGLLPRKVIERDPLYATAFFANLGSLGMDACYHHLYDYGTIGIFSCIGRAVTEPGSPTSGPDRRRTMRVRFTFDERVEDGLAAWQTMRRIKQIAEDPEAFGLTPYAAGKASRHSDERVDGAALP